MPNYQDAKIYGIRSQSTDKIYIGSTVKKSLARRFSGHKCNYKNWLIGNFAKVSSFDIIAFGDSEIYLIEDYPCLNKDELRIREEYWIEQNRGICVNQYRAFLTPENEKARDKAYNDKYHLDHRKERNEQALLRSSRLVLCACGTEYRAGHKNRHLASKKHLANLIK